MNAHAPITAAEPTHCMLTERRAIDADRFRKLALSQRSHSHRYRQWARESAAQGHRAAADGFTKSANRYASDALWYWRRSRLPAVQFNIEDAS